MFKKLGIKTWSRSRIPCTGTVACVQVAVSVKLGYRLWGFVNRNKYCES